MLIFSNVCFGMEKTEKDQIIKYFIKEYQKAFDKQHYQEGNMQEFFYYQGCGHAYHEMIHYMYHFPDNA